MTRRLPLFLATFTFAAFMACAMPGIATAQDGPYAAETGAAKPTTPPAPNAGATTPAKVEARDPTKTQSEAEAFVMPKLETLGYAHPWQMTLQKSYSPVKHAITSLHNGVTVLMFVVVIFVLALLAYVCIRFRAKRNPVPSKVSHNTTIEILWTALPILILIGIAIPTLRLHYGLTYNFADTDMTIKVTGHQWYWSYEYPDDGIAFDSNLKKKDELVGDEPYLLAVDNPVVVPVGKKIAVEMTSADVIHSWALPALGVKRDTVPGKLNVTWFKAEKEGIYYGQCSELCGKFHGFMPITVKAVSPEVYEAWKADAKVKFAGSRYGTTDVAAK